jgi:type VI protein secretion system component Hcp
MNSTFRLISSLLRPILLCGLLGATTLRAQDYFLEILGPNIFGLSLAEGYAGQIEVQSYSFANSRSVEIGGGGVGLVPGAPAMDGFECVLLMDGRAYASLWQRSLTTGAITDVILRGVSFSGGTAFEFLKVELKTVLIESISQVGTAGDRPVVSVRFRPTAVRITSRYLDNMGQPQPTPPMTVQWNFLTNSANFP